MIIALLTMWTYYVGLNNDLIIWCVHYIDHTLRYIGKSKTMLKNNDLDALSTDKSNHYTDCCVSVNYIIQYP